MAHLLCTRRSFLRGTLCTTLGTSLGLLVTSARPGFAFWPRRPPPRESPPADTSPTRLPAASPRPALALSLAVLQAEAASAQQVRQSLRNELAHLGGMNRLQGFTTEADGDLILLGDRDASCPPLHLDDLAVALRNAYQVSPAYHGTPGCTIDPSPGKDPWQVQTVKVFGMPTSTAMAQRHVALDYELKRVTAGIVSLGDGIMSLYDLNRQAETLCPDTAHPGQPTAITHRFWFYPRYPEPPRFLVQGSTVLVLKPVDVQLLTEQQFLDSTGHRTGAAPPAPQAERFAQRITTFLATHPPAPYAQMVGDFRVIEAAKLMEFQRVPAASLHYLLHEHPLTSVSVPRFVGGIRREEQGEVLCSSQIIERPGPKGPLVQTQNRVQRYRHTARGGVEVKITLPSTHFVEERAGVLEPLRRQVRAARPAPRALVWRIVS